MKTFAGQQIEPLFQFSWLVVFLSLLLCGSVAVVLGFSVDPRLAVAVSLSLLALLYLFFGETRQKHRPSPCAPSHDACSSGVSGFSSDMRGGGPTYYNTEK